MAGEQIVDLACKNARRETSSDDSADVSKIERSRDSSRRLSAGNNHRASREGSAFRGLEPLHLWLGNAVAYRKRMILRLSIMVEKAGRDIVCSTRRLHRHEGSVLARVALCAVFECSFSSRSGRYPYITRPSKPSAGTMALGEDLLKEKCMPRKPLGIPL